LEPDYSHAGRPQKLDVGKIQVVEKTKRVLDQCAKTNEEKKKFLYIYSDNDAAQSWNAQTEETLNEMEYKSYLGLKSKLLSI
jgi:translation elongation factor P/translation initiation factor 5A